jgi:hypothetical protein
VVVAIWNWLGQVADIWLKMGPKAAARESEVLEGERAVMKNIPSYPP